MDSATRGVLDAAKGVLGQLDLEGVLDRLVQAARELVGAEYGALGVLGEPGSDANGRTGLARFITVGVDEVTRASLGALPSGLGVLGELIGDPVPLRLADIGRHPHSYGFPSGHPYMGTFLGVPVFVAGRLFGSLYLTEKRDGVQFTAADEAAVVALAELGGIAIENARRHAVAWEHRGELERTVAALSATTEIVRAVGGQTDLDAILELVAKRGRALVSARLLLIVLERGKNLVVAAGAGEMPEGLLGRRLALEGTVVSQALRTRSTQRLEDDLNRRRFDANGVSDHGIYAECGLVVPLVFKDRSYGALCAVDHIKGDAVYSRDDQRLLEAFAASAATAVATGEAVATDFKRSAAVIESSSDAILTASTDGVITSWNHGAEILYGYTAEEMIGQAGQVLLPVDRLGERQISARVLAGEGTERWESMRRRKDGSLVEVSMSVSAIRDSHSNVLGVASIVRDMTEQKQMERALAQTQRLDSLGALAGGVAHDMNNQLAVILNYADFALEALEDDRASEEIGEIRFAAERAAALVSQLMLFARQEEAAVQTLDVAAIVGELERMLSRTIGEHITLITALADESSPIQADRAQVEQVVMNLVVNARDAMPDGGTLTISTANVTLDKDSLKTRAGPAQPGDYLCLAVSDTGIGMPADVVAKAFEPFFTTKPKGSGTGLGLATVYGVLRKAQGHVQIYSEPGHGTAIKTYWLTPQTKTAHAPLSAPDTQLAHTPAGETILLVEDEHALRSVAIRILRSEGYNVLEAALPSVAIALAAQHGDDVDLLLTDLVMPEMSGAKLAEQLKSTFPDLPVLYTSGYVAIPAELPHDAVVVSKPFTRKALITAVGRALQVS